jgi:tRNA-dihydrouridine synthase A
MMGWTDRHFRYLFRLMSRHARLYTVMVTSNALIHADPAHFLDFSAEEQPVALQLGGNNPQELAVCAKMAQDWGYDEVNLNVGCPSDRVQNGQFGACLMKQPELVGECVQAMQQVVDIPVTVKIRIGVDELDSEEYFNQFVDTVAAAGCEIFLVHARKAWLQGLSPRQNRTVPPLKYDIVQRLKQRRDDLTIVINGGIRDLEATQQHLQQVDGVMIGRAAYENPYEFAALDQALFGECAEPLSRIDLVRAYLPYIQQQIAQDVPLKVMSRHLLHIFNKQTGAKGWRRFLSNYAHKQGAGPQVVEHALKCVV